MISTNSFQTYSDTDIIGEILQGKTALFEILIRRYNPVLYKIGRGYGYIHDDTEDLMQEAFIDCFQALSKFEYRSTFKTWLIRIMLNKCYHRVRKLKYRERIHIEMSEDSGSMFVNRSSNQDSMINKELNNVIESALYTLPEEYRITFMLRELTGLSTAETADMMNITPSNVKVRLNRAKIMLRKEIEKIYTPADIYEFNLVYCDKIVEGVMESIQK
jgi:RNA polymerase sigma-70 factor (ECF subfamily)